MPLPSTLKSYTLSLATWSFFSFSMLLLTEIFLNGVMTIIVFSILAIGYIFYFSIQHERFPNANVFGFSMIGFNTLILLLNFSYGEIVLLEGVPGLPYKTFVFFLSTLFITPVAYLILLSVIESTNRKFK